MIVSETVEIHRLGRIWLGTPLLLAALLGNAAHAFQRVTLRNGFSYDCARYEHHRRTTSQADHERPPQ